METIMTAIGAWLIVVLVWSIYRALLKPISSKQKGTPLVFPDGNKMTIPKGITRVKYTTYE